MCFVWRTVGVGVDRGLGGALFVGVGGAVCSLRFGQNSGVLVW